MYSLLGTSRKKKKKKNGRLRPEDTLTVFFDLKFFTSNKSPKAFEFKKKKKTVFVCFSNGQSNRLSIFLRKSLETVLTAKKNNLKFPRSRGGEGGVSVGGGERETNELLIDCTADAKLESERNKNVNSIPSHT